MLSSFLKKSFFSLLIFLIGHQIFSQKNTSHPVDNFPFKHFEFLDWDQGLKSRHVCWIMQDRHGFIWLITDNGLKRYDGNTFRSWSYKPNDPDAFEAGWYWGMSEDKNGTLWIPSEIKGIYSFDPKHEKFTRYRHQLGNTNSLIEDNTWAIATESNGNIWIGTSKGLDKYNPQTKLFTHFVHHADDASSISYNDIFCMVIDDKDSAIENRANLWLINKKLGIDCFNTKSGKVIKHFDFPFPASDYRWETGANPSLSTHELKNNVFWLGSNDNGMYGFNTQAEQFIHIKAAHVCHSSRHVIGFYPVMEDHAGNLWTMNDDNELIYYDRTNQKFYFHEVSKPNIIFEHFSSVIFEDKSGKIFIGTQNGLLTVDTKQKPFVTYQLHSTLHSNPSFSISDNSIAHFHQQNEGQVGVCENLFNLLDRKDKIFSSVSLAEFSNPFPPTDFYQDSKGVLWITAGDLGIVSYDPGTKKSHQYKIDRTTDRIIATSFRGIVEDLKGRLWAANSANGLYKIDVNSWKLYKFNLNKKNNFGSTNYFESIYRDSRGIIYLGAWEKGFVTFNPDSETFVIYHHDANDPTSVSSETARVFHEAKNGLIWFGTINTGINVFNPATGKFRAFTTGDEFQNFISSITEDKNGNYWVGSRYGISCFTPPDDPFDPGYKIQFRNYNMNDGLPSNFCSAGSGFCDDDGTLYFGVRGGSIFYFNPNDLKDNDFHPPVYITDFRLRNKPVTIKDSTILKTGIEFTKEIKLNYKQNIISFSFAALNYVRPEKNKYAYMLEGFDEDWIITDASKRFANYTNLNHGTYTFKVKASNNDGIWNETPTKLKIIITPPFWQTTWFRILIGLTVLGIVYAFYRYRIGQILLLQRIRNKIAADLHDDIGSTLNSISVYSEVAKKDASRKDFALNMIGENSRRIIDSMSDIVWSINPENDNFDRIIFRMRSLTHNLLKAKKIDCTFKADESLNELKLPMQTRRNFYLIFKEVLNNLVKYSQAGRASVTLIHENRQVSLIVRDDGIGFDVSAKYNGNGLNNIRRRANEIKAQLSIESSGGAGTTVELNLRV